jgi:hypothetical protein
MNTNEVLQESLNLIKGELEKEKIETGLMPNITLTYDMLRDWLAGKVSYLMKHNFHKLLSILYRIDVHENNVKRVFDEYTPDEIPSMIAELIIQRQIQKAKTRIAYRKKQDEANKS